MFVRILTTFILTLCSSILFAFPEMVRHNYPNCISCHVSPTGGGVLTKYGRELSREILSMWGTKNENEAQFAYNLVRTPDWLDLLGIYRGVYAYQKTPFITEGKYIFMQQDLEAAAHTDTLFLDVAVGYQNPPGGAKVPANHFISRRHYLNYRPREEISVRVGRFYPAFGIHTPDHIIATRRDLGFNQSQETYNFEAAVLQPNWSLFLTAILGRYNVPKASQETGFVVTPSISIADHYKVGASFLYTQSNSIDKVTYGVWAILGFTPHFFLLTETDWQKTYKHGISTGESSGFVNYQRLDYEVTQGLHFFLTDDYSQLDWSDGSRLHNTYGAGIQVFPRPHLEINFSWLKKRDARVSPLYSDFAWFMVNYYL